MHTVLPSINVNCGKIVHNCSGVKTGFINGNSGGRRILTRIIEIRPTKLTLMKPKWSKNRNEDGGWW